MKLSAVALALYLVACAPKPIIKDPSQFRPSSDTTVAPEPARMFVVWIGPGGCACPFQENLAYTPYHVLQAMDMKPVWFKDDGTKVPLEIVEYNEAEDFAVVKSPEPFPYWHDRAEGAPLIGETVVTIGRSDFLVGRTEVALTFGTVLGSQKAMLLVAALTFPGMSGGCVVNSHGNLVGLHVASRIYPRRPDITGIAISVPIWK